MRTEDIGEEKMNWGSVSSWEEEMTRTERCPGGGDMKTKIRRSRAWCRLSRCQKRGNDAAGTQVEKSELSLFCSNSSRATLLFFFLDFSLGIPR